MSKSKPEGLRAHVTHVFSKVFKTPSSSAPPSRSTTPFLTSDSLASPASELSGSALQVPLPVSSPLAQPVSALPCPTPLSVTFPFPVGASPVPSLHISETLHDLPSTPFKGIAWSGLTASFRALHASAELFPSLQLAIGGLLIGFDMLEEAMKSEKEWEPLVRELKIMSETLNRHLPGMMASPVVNFLVEELRSIQKQVDFIANAQGRDSIGRLIRAGQTGEAFTKCEQHIRIIYRQLQVDTDLSTRSKEQNVQLEGLNPAKLATYDSTLSTDTNRRACTENTRTGVFSYLHTWLADPRVPKVCWMNGMAGTGKTTIAYTFAQELEKQKQLAASFFCSRTAAECRDVTRIVPTIAYQLARHSAPFQSSLCRVLRDNPDLLCRAIPIQFEKMLKEPLLETKGQISRGLVVVIDALDECDAIAGVMLVLDVLLREATDLPLKFFVTSRPERGIRGRIQAQLENELSVYELHNVKLSDVQADIELYLREELPSIEQSQVKQLAKLSGCLFIYAATAVRYIQAGNQKERLRIMLSLGSGSNKRHAEIDALYTAILAEAFDEERWEEDELNRMKLVLWTAICARKPMSVRALAALVDIDDADDAVIALDPLRSVLYVSEDREVVSTLHASFADYVSNPARRSLSFACNPERHDEFLARRCFEVMRGQLHFNMCGLESSHSPDGAICDLEKRISEAISPTLAYACHYWADHLERAPVSDELRIQLEKFLSERLLFWAEVMNLKQRIGLAVRTMLAARQWVLANYSSSELPRLIEDAWNFIVSIAANPTSRSTPHIYISALPFCHQSSTVYGNYWRKMQGLIEPKGAGIKKRGKTIVASWDVDASVNSVAYSPDGNYIAIGCGDGSVLIKDAYSGTTRLAPLRGHTEDVLSVTFSPSGGQIASGSRDHTIRIWDAENGTLVGTPLQGHTDAACSIAFSPNGKHIVSGSGDWTIRLWSTEDGNAVGSPLRGHTDAVWSVAFSPDGTRIASGSLDKTIRVWGAKDGNAIGSPFQGHTDDVWSVAFSPDGARIVSGSYDRTIRVWDVKSGTTIGAPLQGHASAVYSVVFSPDGTRIASGSHDNTICMWSAEDGTAVGAPLQGHTDAVWSVTFSPDGTRIISGSLDKTIRMWNAEDRTSVDAPLLGHTHTVCSVAFSPDGRYVVSGSHDHTIRVWNSEDGTAVGTPLRGHTSSVWSAVFSPDGTRIASGSLDKTIRVWNVEDGAVVIAPLQGHTEDVLSVSFSPDGTQIVSGSRDCTIRVWDANNGTTVGSPLQGHADAVWSVAFSPDGTRIASGSLDRTIRIWYAETGAAVGAPLQGHTDAVCSVAFSPDGTRIVSGSDDKTIRLWSAENMIAIGAPIQSHTGAVWSVSFSPDGTHIVSASDDKTIRMWNAEDGTAVGAPIQGHTSTIYSVAFSPDGTRIVSGSDDKTIRMWDTKGGNAVAAPPQCQARPVRSVGFSPDCSGVRVPPTSSDATTCKSKPHDNILNSVDTWSVTKDGWVVGPDSQLFFWIPQDLAVCIPSPLNVWVIGQNGEICVDYSNLLLGNDWRSCYLLLERSLSGL